jgi:hypothetical protein
LDVCLTTLGIGALVYAAVLFSGATGSNQDIKSLIIYGILGVIFYVRNKPGSPLPKMKLNLKALSFIFILF